MHGMIEWFARNGVAANLMMVFIVASGLLAAPSANEEVFPEMELDRISVEVPSGYRRAAALLLACRMRTGSSETGWCSASARSRVVVSHSP